MITTFIKKHRKNEVIVADVTNTKKCCRFKQPLSYPLGLFLNTHEFIYANIDKLYDCLQPHDLDLNDYMCKWYDVFKLKFPEYNMGDIDESRPQKIIAQVCQKIQGFDDPYYYLRQCAKGCQYNTYEKYGHL